MSFYGRSLRSLLLCLVTVESVVLALYLSPTSVSPQPVSFPLVECFAFRTRLVPFITAPHIVLHLRQSRK